VTMYLVIWMSVSLIASPNLTGAGIYPERRLRGGDARRPVCADPAEMSRMDRRARVAWRGGSPALACRVTAEEIPKNQL